MIFSMPTATKSLHTQVVKRKVLVYARIILCFSKNDSHAVSNSHRLLNISVLSLSNLQAKSLPIKISNSGYPLLSFFSSLIKTPGRYRLGARPLYFFRPPFTDQSCSYLLTLRQPGINNIGETKRSTLNGVYQRLTLILQLKIIVSEIKGS